MEYKKLSIKEWAIEDRPREKLVKKGIHALSDSELIAILIGSGNRKETAVQLAQKMLNSTQNNLNDFGKLKIHDLTEFEGIGEAKAITLIAALELGKRRKLAGITKKTKITQSRDVFDFLNLRLADLPYEEFWVLLLNRSNTIIEEQKISQGGLSGTVTDVRLILHEAVVKLASSVILCHNHPSGNKNPSKADIKITEKLVEAGKLLDIQILDHIIITETEYYSFADEGQI